MMAWENIDQRETIVPRLRIQRYSAPERLQASEAGNEVGLARGTVSQVCHVLDT
jgi:hypothetical protein